MIRVILLLVILLYFLLPYLKPFLDKQKKEAMENMCETKYHMNKYKYKINKIENPYSYSDIDESAPPVVIPNLPISIPSMSPTLQTLNTLSVYNKDDDSSLFNIVGKNNRITGFFTDTSFYK